MYVRDTEFCSWCTAVQELTEINDHNRARRTIASYIGACDIVEMFDHVIALHEAIGHMPHGLIETRDWLTQEKLLPLMIEKLGKERAEKLWNCL